MNRRMLAKVAVLAFALAGTACAQRATRAAGENGAVLLRFRPEPGQSYRTVSVMDASTSQTSMGRDLHTHRVLTFVTRYDVDEAPSVGGALHMRTLLESVQAEQDGPGGHVTYDSSDPSSDVPWTIAPYALLVGRTVTVTVAADGSQRIEGGDSLMDELVSRVNAPPGVSGASFRAMVKKLLGGGSLMAAVRQSGSMLPDHPVSVGDSWTLSMDLGGTLPIHQAMTLTLRERRNGVAIIETRSETSNDSTAAGAMGPMSMGMKSTGTGSMEIDEATGWTLRSTFETESSTIMVLERSPAGRQEIPITTHVVFTTRRAEGN